MRVPIWTICRGSCCELWIPKGVEGGVILCGLGWIRYLCLVHDGLVL
jgi:hypothetical protein